MRVYNDGCLRTTPVCPMVQVTKDKLSTTPHHHGNVVCPINMWMNEKLVTFLTFIQWHFSIFYTLIGWTLPCVMDPWNNCSPSELIGILLCWEFCIVKEKNNKAFTNCESFTCFSDMDDTLYPLSSGLNLACRKNIEGMTTCINYESYH